MYRRHVRARFRLYYGRARRFVLYRLLHTDDPPYKLAMGVAVGVFITFTPTIGLQMALCVGLAWMLRANAFVGIPIVWISNPLTFVPIYYPLYLLGASIVGVEPVGQQWFIDLVEHSPEGWWAGVKHFANQLLGVAGPLWTGCIVFATLTAVPSYYVTYYAIWGYRMRKWGSLTPPGSRRSKVEDGALTPAPDLGGHPITLASASPRRAKMLREAGYEFTVVPAPIDESAIDLTGLSPKSAAVELAHRKARAVSDITEAGFVLAADTLIALGDTIIGKPNDADEAREILGRLTVETHEVITAVCIVVAETGGEHAFVETTTVQIDPIDPAELDAYIASDAWQGKAGGYNLDELREVWNFELDGDPTSVVGLPMKRLARELREFVEDIAARKAAQ